MAIDSPMSNFNRKNPYVIQAKQQYERLLRLYESISKSLISYGTWAIASSIVFIAVSIYKKQYILLSIAITVLIAFGLLTYSYILRTIRNPINHEIDHMVTLESNEVLKISVEYVQELLYKLHYCIGIVTESIYWYRIYCILTTSLSLVLLMMEVI